MSCTCWVEYPNIMHLKKNYKWKCVDDYVNVRPLEYKNTYCGKLAVRKTMCVKKGEEVRVNRYECDKCHKPVEKEDVFQVTTKCQNGVDKWGNKATEKKTYDFCEECYSKVKAVLDE